MRMKQQTPTLTPYTGSRRALPAILVFTLLAMVAAPSGAAAQTDSGGVATLTVSAASIDDGVSAAVTAGVG